MNGGIPDNVRSFVLQHIDSVAGLEVLLLVHDHRGRAWTPDEAAAELRIEPMAAESRLADLRDHGLVAGDAAAGFTFSPRTAAQGAAVADLARCYQTHRVAVITLIFSKPSDRIRSFADAFRLRRGEDDG